MKVSGKIMPAALMASLLLTGSACGGSSRPSGNAGGDADPAETTTTTVILTTEDLEQDDIDNPVDISEFVDDSADKLDDPNITYLGYYDIRTSADIKPAVKLFQETYGGEIEYNQCTWSERIEKLQVLIASGDSPDLVDREGESFPLLASKNVYEDLTDYIDLSQPQWAGFEQLVNQYEWNGKHVYYPWHVSALPTYVYYSNTRFEEYGVTSPRDLYSGGEWDWNTFRDTIKKFMDASGSSNEVYGVYGLTMPFAAIASTGTGTIGIENGKLSNNINSPAIDRAASFLESLRRDGLTIAQDGYWGDQGAPIAEGKACFLVGGQYLLKGFQTDYPEADVQFVPFPKDPEADKYYNGVDTFGYLVPKGAKNIKGSAAFINMNRLCKIDPDLRAVVDESRMTKDKWTEEQIEFMKQFEDISNYDVVVDLYSGLDSDTSGIINDMFVDVTFYPDRDTWTVLRDTNLNVINAAIDEINNG